MLVGCQSQKSAPEGYFNYPTDDVEGAVAALSFQPEMPQFVPIPVDFVISDHFFTASDQEALDISFYSRENDLLTYQVIKGELELLGETTVEISETVQATYTDNDFAKTLIWHKDGLSYKLVFRSGIINAEQVSDQVTKADLVRVAQSFQL